MGDVMLFGILRMPYDMAMENEISRHQYWQSGQQAADEIERLREALKDIDGQMRQADRYLLKEGTLLALRQKEAT